MFGRYRIRHERKPIRDKLRIQDGDAHIDIDICAAPGDIIPGVARAQAMLKGLNADMTRDEIKERALALASAIFGEDQAQKLLDFYGGDATCVMELSIEYFSKRLKKKLTKAQKRMKK